jgi:hypothetical protein
VHTPTRSTASAALRSKLSAVKRMTRYVTVLHPLQPLVKPLMFHD